MWERTEDQEANLLALADFLDKDPSNFDMGNFAENDEQSVDVCAINSDHNCGTVCCAIGMSPFIFPEKCNKSLRVGSYLDWQCLGDYLYGKLNMFAWDWMFSHMWTRYDNTPRGAARRIRYFVKNGLPNYVDNYMKYITDFDTHYKDWCDANA